MFYLVSVSSCRLGWCVCSAVCRSTVMKREREREREKKDHVQIYREIFLCSSTALSVCILSG